MDKMQIAQVLDVETFVLCERAARDAGKTVREWLSSFVSDKVGHTSFCVPDKVGHTSRKRSA